MRLGRRGRYKGPGADYHVLDAGLFGPWDNHSTTFKSEPCSQVQES